MLPMPIFGVEDIGYVTWGCSCGWEKSVSLAVCQSKYPVCYLPSMAP